MKSILRFLKQTDTKDEGCWTWSGGLSGDGYGSFTYRGRQVGAHRYAAKFLAGLEIEGKVVRHKCDNPRCVNPEHLATGTHLENVHDMFSRNRNAPTNGESNGNAKLTEDDVDAIKRSSEPSKVLALRYGICAAHAQRIRSGKRWRHLNRACRV